MSMPCRSFRDTTRSIVDPNATPAAVGPGSYGGDVQARRAAPSYAGFSSSDARKINVNKATSSITPGPGAYVARPSYASAPVAANTFKTRVARMAPVAPGSTEFQPSTSAAAPGPGEYEPVGAHKRSVGDGFDRRDGLKIGGSGMATRKPPGAGVVGIASVNGGAPPAVGPNGRYNPPTIPRPMQSFGYEETSAGPKPLDPPADTYTGLGADSVGPAFYDPQVRRTVYYSQEQSSERDATHPDRRSSESPNGSRRRLNRQRDVNARFRIAAPLTART